MFRGARVREHQEGGNPMLAMNIPGVHFFDVPVACAAWLTYAWLARFSMDCVSILCKLSPNAEHLCTFLQLRTVTLHQVCCLVWPSSVLFTGCWVVMAFSCILRDSSFACGSPVRPFHPQELLRATFLQGVEWFLTSFILLRPALAAACCCPIVRGQATAVCSPLLHSPAGLFDPDMEPVRVLYFERLCAHGW